MSPVSKSKRMATATIADPKILIPAIGDSFKKLDPRLMVKNPVMFVVEVVAALTTVLFVRDVFTGAGHYGFSLQIILWLWFTVLFANFAEAVAEGRGKAQAASLRATKTDVVAKKLADARNRDKFTELPAVELKPGDIVFVEAGDLIPSDGEVIEGVASVNEAAITGEVRAGHPGVGRRPLGRDRWHDGDFRLDCRAHHRCPRLDLPRPDDRACRRCRASENAQ